MNHANIFYFHELKFVFLWNSYVPGYILNKSHVKSQDQPLVSFERMYLEQVSASSKLWQRLKFLPQTDTHETTDQNLDAPEFHFRGIKIIIDKSNGEWQWINDNPPPTLMFHNSCKAYMIPLWETPNQHDLYVHAIHSHKVEIKSHQSVAEINVRLIVHQLGPSASNLVVYFHAPQSSLRTVWHIIPS